MGLWYRVFGGTETMPDTEGIVTILSGLSREVQTRFEADDAGWFRSVLQIGPGTPVILERWLVEEEGIRAELNTWAAFLETCDYSPHHVPLMERTIQTKQLFTFRKPIDHPNEGLIDRVCVSLCQHLAQTTLGFYQIDDVGFYERDGTLLVQEF